MGAPEKSSDPTNATVLRFAKLAKDRAFAFDFLPDAGARKELAGALKLSALKKLHLHGLLSPSGRADWHLSARLGATVVQPCVITLAPVTTRIDADVTRLFLAEMREIEAEPGSEIEMIDDTGAEALPALLDLTLLALEALALNIPDWPKAPGAELGEAIYTAPGQAPMRDEDARPFAGLAGLRDRLPPQDPEEGE